jgi:hypothetical protein
MLIARPLQSFCWRCQHSSELTENVDHGSHQEAEGAGQLGSRRPPMHEKVARGLCTLRVRLPYGAQIFSTIGNGEDEVIPPIKNGSEVYYAQLRMTAIVSLQQSHHSGRPTGSLSTP